MSAFEPSPIVEEFLHAPIPKELWHYTSVAGLKGILASNTVFATEAHQTKDATEFIHAKQIALDYLNSLESSDPHLQFARRRSLAMVEHAFAEGYLSRDVSEVFVASFSAAPDLKSQWIEFADQARGVNLCFDLRGVRPPQVLHSAVTVAPCVYEDADKRHLVNASLSHFLTTAQRLSTQFSDLAFMAAEIEKAVYVARAYGDTFNEEEFKKALLKRMTFEIAEANRMTTYDLLRVASHCKNAGFRQELEWRLALPHLKQNAMINAKIEYRGVNKDIPYVACNLFQADGRLPLRKVMLGPLCGDQSAIQAVLKETGYDIPICVSSIPLR